LYESMLSRAGTLDGGTPRKMEIAFRTKALRAVCLSGDRMHEQYGAEGAATLKGRLADIRAAECLRDVPILTLCPLLEGAGDSAVLDVGGGMKIIVKANHRKPPTLQDGVIDWGSINRILIQRIEMSNV